MQIDIKKSQIDDSVNFNYEKYNSIIECRYVRRNKDKVSLYVSSATGCNQLCKFCHLTTTKQYYTKYLSVDDILEQLNIVYKYYVDNTLLANQININFMAKGDPLLNKCIFNGEIIKPIKKLIPNAKINISTIFPEKLNLIDLAILSDYHIYYSLYSIDPLFRKVWMPNAGDFDLALQWLRLYSILTNNKVTIHYALIKNENDSIDSAKQIINKITQYIDKNKIRLSLVRYNPYSSEEGEMSDNYINYIKIFENNNIEAKIIERVGFDVKASCGMFLND